MTNPFLPHSVYEGAEFNPIAGNEGYQEMLQVHFMIALATFEGFFKEGSISQRNNNPGNLRPVGASTGFRKFDTPLIGWNRLMNQIEINVKRGLTLEEFFLGKQGVYSGYAPLGDNDAKVMDNYLNYMANQTGIRRNDLLQAYFPKMANYELMVPLFHRWAPPQRK